MFYSILLYRIGLINAKLLLLTELSPHSGGDGRFCGTFRETFQELKQQNSIIELSCLTKLDSYMFTLGL